jgi:hypothetical protein
MAAVLAVGEADAGAQSIRPDRGDVPDADRGIDEPDGGVFVGNATRGSAGHQALMPRNRAGHGNVLRLLLGRTYLRAPVGAPEASLACCQTRGATALAGAHGRLAQEAHAHAVRSLEAALTAAGLDVWAHLDDAGVLAPILGGAVVAIPAGAGGDGNFRRRWHCCELESIPGQSALLKATPSLARALKNSNDF